VLWITVRYLEGTL